MMNLPIIGLMVGFATLGQGQAEMPEAWKQKIEAAAKAEKSGDRIAAEVLLIELVREGEKIGETDLRLAAPLELLGGFYMDRRRERYAESEPLLRRALVIRQKAQGVNHPDVAVTLVRLASCLQAAKGKEAETAGPMLRRAMTILDEVRR